MRVMVLPEYEKRPLPDPFAQKPRTDIRREVDTETGGWLSLAATAVLAFCLSNA